MITLPNLTKVTHCWWCFCFASILFVTLSTECAHICAVLWSKRSHCNDLMRTITHPKLLTLLTLSQNCPKSSTLARESELSRNSLTLGARVLHVSLQGARRGAKLTSVFCAKLRAPSIGASAVKRQLIAVGRRVRKWLSFQCGISLSFADISIRKRARRTLTEKRSFFFLQKTLRAVLLDWRLRVLIIIASFFLHVHAAICYRWKKDLHLASEIGQFVRKKGLWIYFIYCECDFSKKRWKFVQFCDGDLKSFFQNGCETFWNSTETWNIFKSIFQIKKKFLRCVQQVEV